MQELLADLFPWVVALWIVEGLAQPGRGHLLLVAGLRGRFGVRRAGLHLLGLSPWTEAIAAHDLPFLRGGASVFFFDPRRRSEPALVAGEDLSEIPIDQAGPIGREARKVKMGEEVVVLAPTAPWAERIRADLAAAVAAPGGAAPDATRLDVAAVRALRARQRPWVAALRAISGLASALALIAWPAAAWAPHRFPVPPGVLLAALGMLVLAAAGATFGMLGACGEARGVAAATALHLVAYPIAALRPLLHASRSLYRRFDALAIAAALLPREELRVLAGRELWRARLSREATPAALGAAWDRRARDLASVLAQAGIAESEALAPEPAAGGAASFCPLCGAQYRPGFDRCKDCHVAVLPFGGAPAA
ncbi:MAG TPA: hypothetical protein VFL83_00685 [Anaeromyxobacter sp.]|nr:hypothetical protein [Anaeromyxobacter sp.]